jgi:hypothetical protein
MTTTQNDRNSMSDGQLDAVSAGSGYVKIGDVRAPRGAKILTSPAAIRMKELTIWSELGKTGVLRVDEEHKDW